MPFFARATPVILYPALTYLERIVAAPTQWIFQLDIVFRIGPTNVEVGVQLIVDPAAKS